jgi:prevent-host-death family protein
VPRSGATPTQANSDGWGFAEWAWSCKMTNMAGKRSSVRHYNVADAKARLSDLVRKALLGEDVVIAKHNKPLVKLVPLTPGSSRVRTPGSAKGQVSMSADFDRTPGDFTDYV